jgi:hypothetical protein
MALKTTTNLWWFMLSEKPEMSKRREAQTSPLAWAVRMSCWRQRPASTVEDAFLPLNWVVGTSSWKLMSKRMRVERIFSRSLPRHPRREIGR